MAVKFLDKTGLGYFWGKIKAWCNSTFAAIAHTHTSYAVKHSYTTAANAAKNWYRIANANTSQTNTTKPIHAQFILTAYNTSYDAGYYERWFVNAEVFGRNAHIVILGNTSIPFSQARVLYENTIADLDANDRPAIDIYLNYVLPNGTTKIEIEEVYNQGWTFVADGQISASTVPTGFENQSCSIRGNGVERSTYSDYTTYLNKPRREITANTTLADNNTYRSTTLNCTGTITITVPSLNSNYAWFFIKNANSTSGVITIHPSTTSVLIDESNADITLQPNEYLVIHSRATNKYSIIADGRWKSQKADKATTLAGYGITDAKIANGTITLGSNSITPLTSHQTLPTLSRTISGSGNAITDITVSNHAITAAKGSTFLTAASTLDATKLSGTIPSSCYTNTTYTAGTGLSLNGTQFSLTSHSQASDTINAMTGYSKPNSTSAITTSDTLNQAIGKLEKAIDDADITNTVHLTGNEFIGGIKEFGNSYYDSTLEGETDWESSSLIIRYQNYIKGSGVPSANKYANLLFLDKIGNNVNWSGRLGAVGSVVNSSGAYGISISCYKNEIINNFDTHERSTLSVGYDADGIRYASCISTSDSRTNGDDIVTRDWIPRDTRIVHTTGNETISGEKHFTNRCAFHYSISKGIIPSSNLYYSLAFSDDTSLDASVVHRAGVLENKIDTNGVTSTYITAYQWTLGSTNNASIEISIDRSGNASTYAPTPAASSNNNNIATTAWTNSKYVDLTSAQIIAGNKTFNAELMVANNSPLFKLKDTNGEKGNANAGWYLGQGFYDKNNKILGYIYCGRYGASGDKHNVLALRAYKCNSASDTDYGQVFLNYYATPNIAFEPENTNEIMLGRNTRKWKEVWCTQSSINSSSDERLKDDITSIPNEVLDAWEDVNWIQFRFKSAKQEKGDNARFHTGMIAQSINKIFDNYKLDIDKYGFFLYDEWEEIPEVIAEDGIIQQKFQPAGNEYGLRYVEALCIEAAYQRRKNKILENRISELEKQVSDMLILLQNLTNGNG